MCKFYEVLELLTQTVWDGVSEKKIINLYYFT
jgi:hypothetical protein